MAAPDLSLETMQKFRDSGSSEHLTLLLGAGASTVSGLPDWDTFAARLLIGSGSVDDLEVARVLVSRQDPMLVVEAARAAAGSQWDHRLRSALYEGVTAEEPSPLHLAAVGHLLDPDTPDTDLVTLNFDTLLEQAIEHQTAASAGSSTTGQPADGATYTVQHLHGVIRRDRTDRVVLTLSEFYDVIADDSAWQAGCIRAALRRGAILIAGTSYRDPDLRHWLHAAVRDRPPHHQALVLLTRQGFAMTRSQFGEAREALASQWSAIGLQPVLLEDHADAAQMIRELHHVHKADYLSPQQRAQRIWDAHATQFGELQSKYVELLNADAADMRVELGVHELNVSLWLADGNGRIARWAAHDRVYRDVGTLRSVPTGHDSRWTAGEAVGADELLHRDLSEVPTRRWQSVLALPISVPHPRLPALTSAVVTIGLPGAATEYEETAMIWGIRLRDIGEAWASRLGFIGFEGEW